MLAHAAAAGGGWEGQAAGALAALDAQAALVARGAALLRVRIELPAAPVPFTPSKDKQSFPAALPTLEAVPWPGAAHAHPVSDVMTAAGADGRLRVASVDERGHLNVAHADGGEAQPAWTAAPAARVQAGPARVALCPGRDMLATSTFYGRTVALYDGDRCVRQERMLHSPGKPNKKEEEEEEEEKKEKEEGKKEGKEKEEGKKKKRRIEHGKTNLETILPA